MKALFHKLFSQSDSMPFSLTYPDETTEKYGSDGETKFNLIFKTKKAMRAMLINADLGLIDLVVVLGDSETEFAVTLGERLNRRIELCLNETAHLKYCASNRLEILVESSRDMLSQVLDFHESVLTKGGVVF